MIVALEDEVFTEIVSWYETNRRGTLRCAAILARGCGGLELVFEISAFLSLSAAENATSGLVGRIAPGMLDHCELGNRTTAGCALEDPSWVLFEAVLSLAPPRGAFDGHLEAPFGDHGLCYWGKAKATLDDLVVRVEQSVVDLQIDAHAQVFFVHL